MECNCSPNLPTCCAALHRGDSRCAALGIIRQTVPARPDPVTDGVAATARDAGRGYTGWSDVPSIDPFRPESFTVPNVKCRVWGPPCLLCDRPWQLGTARLK